MHTIRIIENAIAVLDGESSLGTCSVAEVHLRRESVAVRESLECVADMGHGRFSLTLRFVRHVPNNSAAVVVSAIEALIEAPEVVSVEVIMSYARVVADFCVMQFHENMAAEDGACAYSFGLREVRRASVC